MATEKTFVVSREFRPQMEGYGLTTAEIHYHLPDYPGLLQLYVWQEYDLAPEFPTLKGFLKYWQRELEGALHSVRVAHHRLINPSEWRGERSNSRFNSLSIRPMRRRAQSGRLASPHVFPAAVAPGSSTPRR